MASFTGRSLSARARGLLAPVWALSGAAVLAGFFFPALVGGVSGGEGWLVLALVFFSSTLTYLVLMPYTSEPAGEVARSQVFRLGRTELRGRLAASLSGVDWPTTLVPVLVFGLYFLLRLLAPATVSRSVGALTAGILQVGGPLFLAITLLAVGYCLFLLLGPWGDIRLGGDDAEPHYTYSTYFALIFTAGIAAGIVFWGPAEALYHYSEQVPYFAGTPRTESAIAPALTYSLFHWGISAWSAYTVLGVPIAYYVFQRGAPLRVSSILLPVIGAERLEAGWSRPVDSLAVFATIGGISTSVALVSEQFLTGIAYQYGVTTGPLAPALFVAGLTVVFTLSAITGVHRGIRRLAGLNVVLFAIFIGLLIGLGPRQALLSDGLQAVGSLAVNFLPLSLLTGDQWITDWTVWNWAWWFSWAPFAGLFLAALSKGRRIRTVVFTSVIATAAASLVWFVLLGGTALRLQHGGQTDILGLMAANGGEAIAGFPVFAALPLGQLLVFLFLGLIVVFMVTSADTSTLVTAILATPRGAAPSSGTILFWGLFQGAVATAVVLAGGAETLQALAVLCGGPFALLSVVALAGLTLTCIRHEEGNRSAVRRVLDRLPTVHMHQGFDPPE